MLYTNLLSRLDITFYINAIEPNNSSSYHMGYTGKDVIRNMMIQPSYELNEILDRQFDYRFDTVRDQKVKLNLKELILWMRLPRNAVSCGSVDSASPDNRRYRRIEICYGSLKETQWTREVYFGFYGHILKDKNGDYKMDAYQHVEVLPNHSFPVLVGEPIRMESNSLNGFGENVLRALVKSSLRKEIGRTLKTKVDVSGIYIDDATYCSMLSLGLVEEISAILNKFEEVNDVVWCVTHQKLSGILAKKLKELINLYLKVFGYHIHRAKCEDLVIPQAQELKNMLLGRLVTSLNRVAMTKPHDLTDTIPWINGVKPKCRKVIGQFGNAFVLPKYCGITKTTISRILYGVFEFKYVAKEKVDKHSDIRVYYKHDTEMEAYSKFIDKLCESEIFLSVSASKVKQPYGEVTRKLFKLYDLPVVIGVSASMTNGKFRQLHTRFNSANVITTCVTDSRDVVIQKIKEHLAKMPAEWRAKRRIPEIYLEKTK